MDVRLFDFELPSHLIAIYPPKEREDARLLVSTSENEKIDGQILDLDRWITANDLIIFNDTKVWKARLNGRRASGGKLSLLITKINEPHHLYALIQSSKALRKGECIEILSPDPLVPSTIAQIIQRLDEGEYLLEIKPLEITLETWLQRFGTIPIPPYFKRPAEPVDEVRYQTTFAHHSGSVAASTAGLHFGEKLLQKIEQKGIQKAFITLHIGLGTFQPVRVDNIEDHQMHQESFHVPYATLQAIQACQARRGRIIAVGTTVLRALESMALYGQEGETTLFIRPGFEFKIVDALITNFHLPRSSLLILIAAFIGISRFHDLYSHAIESNYRFLSYGDAMFLARSHPR